MASAAEIRSLRDRIERREAILAEEGDSWVPGAAWRERKRIDELKEQLLAAEEG